MSCISNDLLTATRVEPSSFKNIKDIAYFLYARHELCKHELCNKKRATCSQLNCFAAVSGRSLKLFTIPPFPPVAPPHGLISRFKKFITTRQHSSRMRSTRLLTVRDSVATTRCQYRWGGYLRSHGIPTH